MADINYYINSTIISVDSYNIWGNQDVDGDGIQDMGILPLEMTIHANEDYTVDAPNFTIKGYEPTSVFLNTDGIEVREWLNGDDTTDAGGNVVENIQVGGDVNTGSVNKVQMYNTGGYNLTWPASLNPQDLNGGVETGSDAALVIDLYPPYILLDGSPIETGDLIGFFGEENGIYTCFGFIVWDDSMPPALLTIRGDDGDDGFGFTPGQEMHIFIRDTSTNTTYKTEVTWNTATIPFAWTDGADGYVDSANYQILSTSNVSFPLTALDNTVKVKAWLDSGYNILGSNDIQLHLDIDGDAQPDDVEPPQQQYQFNIILKLKEGENSNAIVEANTGWYGDAISFSSNPGWYAEAVNVDDHTAKITFTKNLGNGWLELGTPSAGISAFIIKPKNSNYTVSKDNFWVETVGDSTTNYFTFAYDWGTWPINVDTTANVKVNQSSIWDSEEGVSIYSNPAYWLYYNYGVYNTETYPNPNPDFDPSSTSGSSQVFTSETVDIVKNVRVGLEDGDNIEYINFSDLTPSIPQPTEEYIIPLSQSHFAIHNAFYANELNNIGMGASSINDILDDSFLQSGVFTWDDSYVIRSTEGLLNPIDWVNNIVFIHLRFLNDYKPLDNLQTGTNIPKNLIFEIEGSAMEIEPGSMPTVEMYNLITEEIN